MTFLTGLALKRSSVTILVMLMIMVGGVIVYNQLDRELFPSIEFPNLFITTLYPSADPETVSREVSEPIEDAISGMSGLKELQSTSQENFSVVVATFNFGEDIVEAKRTIESNINSIQFPDGVENPTVTRISNDTFPVLEMVAIGDRDIASMQRILEDTVIPRFEGVEGVSEVNVLGQVDEQVTVTVNTDKLEDLGLSMLQVTDAIRSNNIGFPAGNIVNNEINFPVRATHELGSLEEIRNLTVGYERVVLPEEILAGTPPSDLRGQRQVLLSDVAEVELGTAKAKGISRANGKPALSITVVKDPEANTVNVTRAITDIIEDLDVPPDVRLLIMVNQGPQVEETLSSLLREGFFGFLFAISAVFVFLISFRPTLLRGLFLTLRPTIIIGISIPLSVLTGILLMSLTDITLNFMSLAGLAIAVGRVVDDSIVVLENIYRHIHLGVERMEAAITGTREVGAAIVSSTLTTVVVFIPLAFIQGLVGEFFTPFAVSVSFALLASTFVALTAVPVLAVILLRRGDLPDVGDDDAARDRRTLLQRLYAPVLAWSISHKAISLLLATVITAGSLALMNVIPVTFFPAGTPEYLLMNVKLQPGADVGKTFRQVEEVEEVLQRFVDEGHLTLYQVTIGRASSDFGLGAGGGTGGNLHLAGFTIRVDENAPLDIADRIRAQLPDAPAGTTISLTEVANGPANDELEVNIVGPNFTTLAQVARELEAELAKIDGIINLESDVTAARDEINVNVHPEEAAEFGLTALAVALQINQFIVGQEVGEVDLENITLDVVVRGEPEDVDDIEKLKNLSILGPLGLVKLGSISDITIEQGPVTVSRFDGERSASITGTIIARDTQAVGNQVQAVVDAMQLPPGVEIKTGGIFQQIAEGFQQVFIAMAVGILLVYLVMVASLGSLRNPLIIVLSLPLAIVGALAALAITDRSLSLSAMMGFLLLIGIVVTNAIVLITFVEQLREEGVGVKEALIEGGSVRIRPILMTAFTTTFALLPLALSSDDGGGIIGAELATVVIGGLISSTALTLLVVPVIYTLMHWSIPRLPGTVRSLFRRQRGSGPIRSLRDEG